MQLVGHLRRHALQVWELLSEDQKSPFCTVVTPLERDWIQVYGRWLCRISIMLPRRVRKLWLISFSDWSYASGWHMGRSPSVSGAQSYSSLCLAAKDEEMLLTELRKRHHCKSNSETSQGFSAHVGQRKSSSHPPPMANESSKRPTSFHTSQAQRKCYTCGRTKHL